MIVLLARPRMHQNPLSLTERARMFFRTAGDLYRLEDFRSVGAA
jgi:hypothetical protein